MWKQIVKPPLFTGSSDSQSYLKSHQPERNWRPSGSCGRCKRAGREMAQSTQWSTTVQAVITNNLYPATRKHRDSGQHLGHTYSVRTTRTQVRMRVRTYTCTYVRLTRPPPHPTSPRIGLFACSCQGLHVGARQDPVEKLCHVCLGNLLSPADFLWK